MHLLSLVADRLWLVSNGTVNPYEGDLASYRDLLLAKDKPAVKPAAEKSKPKPKRPTRDAILALLTLAYTDKCIYENSRARSASL